MDYLQKHNRQLLDLLYSDLESKLIKRKHEKKQIEEEKKMIHRKIENMTDLEKFVFLESHLAKTIKRSEKSETFWQKLKGWSNKHLVPELTKKINGMIKSAIGMDSDS